MSDKMISRYQLFILGLFFGFTFLVLAIIIILLIDRHTALEGESHFREIYTLFAGVILL